MVKCHKKKRVIVERCGLFVQHEGSPLPLPLSPPPPPCSPAAQHRVAILYAQKPNRVPTRLITELLR